MELLFHNLRENFALKAVFKNRLYAGHLLAKRLEKFENEDGVVLAVPRGGVPVAYYTAKRFGFPLEIIITKKIGHPHNREFAIGAVSLNDRVLSENEGVSPFYIEEETRRLRLEIKEKYAFYLKDRQPRELKNKTVILIDDGIATGKTVLLTVKMIRAQEPKAIILAVPVLPHTKVKQISQQVDELIYIVSPYDFHSVGQFYENFDQVSDEEVIHFLNDTQKNNSTESGNFEKGFL